MQNPVFRTLMGLVFLVPACFCATTVYSTARMHDYAGAGVMLAIAGLAVFIAFRILPLGKVLDSWAFLIFIETILLVTGGLSIASIYWAVKGSNYAIALITLIAGGGNLLLAISMASRAMRILKQR